MNASANKTGDAKGKIIAPGSILQRIHLYCLDVTKHFPELADLFHDYDSLLKNVDRALSERELAIKSFNEAVKKLCNPANSPTQNPHVVRS